MIATAMKRLKKEEKGFTLIELLAVIVILGIIAAIAVPLILNAVNKSKTDADKATAQQIYDAARLYVTSELEGNYTNATIPLLGDSTTPGLEYKGYLDSGLTLPSTKSAISSGTVVFGPDGKLVSITMITSSTTKTYTALQLK